AAESCRTVRTNLMFMAAESPNKTMVVTSANPKDGKTTVATNIAIALAQSGQRVLLVDADLRRPRIHQAFDLDNRIGLTSALVGERSLSQVTADVGIDKLSVVTCGPLPPNPAELLHTKQFSRLLEEAASQYDRVIFDSPPLRAVTDAAILYERSRMRRFLRRSVAAFYSSFARGQPHGTRSSRRFEASGTSAPTSWEASSTTWTRRAGNMVTSAATITTTIEAKNTPRRSTPTATVSRLPEPRRTWPALRQTPSRCLRSTLVQTRARGWRRRGVPNCRVGVLGSRARARRPYHRSPAHCHAPPRALQPQCGCSLSPYRAPSPRWL
ncbi:MAG: CpsD/CapB family tyrosine-protein kinase, partial [Deltaproteobacteria bacterium]|nr:CpsD/CapB family tyrosine-protein kinase [Deltaproteobacteria bacterium]